MPRIDCRIVLHARIAAQVRGFRDFLQERFRLKFAHDFAGRDGFRLPCFLLKRGLHERIRDAHAVVRVLEKDRFIGDVGIIPHVNQRVGFLFFRRFAGDVLLNIGMIHVQNHHFGRAAGFSAGIVANDAIGNKRMRFRHGHVIRF